MNEEQTFLDQFNPHFIKINEELKRTLGSQISLIEDIGRHSLLGEGKRLRPLLFVLACQLCHYNKDDFYFYSTIFEYIHMASLQHDDVLDNAEIRRKKASANRIWGNSAAVLSGDFYFAKSSHIALQNDNITFVKTVNEACTKMVEGQILELINTNNWRLEKEDYLEIITSKTAALISASCACAAIISDAGEEAARHLNGFGLNLGIAFQLIDDLLDYISSEETFGKPVGKDLREGKITLPLIYTLNNLEESEVNRLENIFMNQEAGEEDINSVLKKVRDNGAIERVRSEAMDYVKKASSFLEFFPESTIKDYLVKLNEYMGERSF